MGKKKVIVTGADGFIGKSLCSFLQENYEVIPITHKEHGDIKQIGNHFSLFDNVSYVFHMASTVHNYNILNEGPSCFIDTQTNVLGTQAVLECLRWAAPEAKMVYVSTFFVNNGNPKGLYGATKLCAEQFCKVYSEVFNIDYSIARLSNVFGVGEQTNNNKKAAMNRMVFDLCRDKEIGVYVPSPYRDYIDVLDVAEALQTIAVKGVGGVYDVCTEKSYKVLDILEMAQQKINKGQIKKIKTPLFHQQVGIENWFCSNRPLRAIGWVPKNTLEESLDRMIEAYIG